MQAGLAVPNDEARVIEWLTAITGWSQALCEPLTPNHAKERSLDDSLRIMLNAAHRLNYILLISSGVYPRSLCRSAPWQAPEKVTDTAAIYSYCAVDNQYRCWNEKSVSMDPPD